MQKFRAGAVKYGFWFAEFTMILPWVLAGDNDRTIRERTVNENPFQLPSVDRRISVTNCVLRRVHSLPQTLQEAFDGMDADNQRLVVFISIMKSDALIEAFMLTCFKDAVVLGDEILEEYELDSFFSNLQANHEETAGWRSETIARLKVSIRGYLRAAGIARSEGDKLLLQRPLIDQQLIEILQANGDENYVLALTGRTNG
ncbi:BrxA family protein [Lacticaseibacillus saniviri]|jgi:hypothetical protein|uniref:BrxA family protein n=1 Tax=Lacticaseibacillus saniviri TaxID=931533 RepID=UPI001EDFF10A|nr:BrxA family protein [Lacticaseibacillus saniviri]MCG4283051.1 DUF1819 family protein [Lacticaseibacillus saniviri]